MCPKYLFFFVAGAGAMNTVHKIVSVCAGQRPQYLGALIWAAFTAFCLYRAHNSACTCNA